MHYCPFQLASDAANVIAMTEEEKKRIEDLLVDVDNIPDLPENLEDVVGYNTLLQFSLNFIEQVNLIIITLSLGPLETDHEGKPCHNEIIYNRHNKIIILGAKI